MYNAIPERPPPPPPRDVADRYVMGARQRRLTARCTLAGFEHILTSMLNILWNIDTRTHPQIYIYIHSIGDDRYTRATPQIESLLALLHSRSLTSRHNHTSSYDRARLSLRPNRDMLRSRLYKWNTQRAQSNVCCVVNVSQQTERCIVSIYARQPMGFYIVY